MTRAHIAHFRLPMFDPIEIGARLRAARQAAGISQREVARRIAAHVGAESFSSGAVHMIEVGHRTPTLGTLDAFAAAVGLSLTVVLEKSTRSGTFIRVDSELAPYFTELSALGEEELAQVLRLARLWSKAPGEVRDAIVTILRAR